jgi:hypothetical protein
MTTPLILQIQAAALDSKESVTDALRKAKIACVKLELREFEEWIDLELNGYVDKTVKEMPQYRMIRGVPQGYNLFHGWQTISFVAPDMHKFFATAPINMTIPAIEESLRNAGNDGSFSFFYSPDVEKLLRDAVDDEDVNLRIKLNVHQVHDILHAVRTILLDWTLKLEKQGVLGENLIFSQEEKRKSEAVTTSTVNSIHINQVGAFALHADHSVMRGSVEATTTTLSQSTLDLVQQVEALLPASKLPVEIQGATQAALGDLKREATALTPDNGRLRKALESLKRVLAPAGETLLKIAVDAAVSKLLTPT